MGLIWDVVSLWQLQKVTCNDRHFSDLFILVNFVLLFCFAQMGLIWDVVSLWQLQKVTCNECHFSDLFILVNFVFLLCFSQMGLIWDAVAATCQQQLLISKSSDVELKQMRV